MLETNPIFHRIRQVHRTPEFDAQSSGGETMNSDTAFWAEVEAIFEMVVDLDDHARMAALEARCQGRPRLRSEIEALLAADGLTDRLIVADTPPRIGSKVGPF